MTPRTQANAERARRLFAPSPFFVDVRCVVDPDHSGTCRHGLSTFRPPCTRCSWDRASHEPRHSKETFDKAGRQVSSASTLAASFVSPLSYLLPSQHPAFSTSKLYPPSLATDTTATRSLDWPYLRIQATKRRSEDCLTQKGQPESPRPPA